MIGMDLSGQVAVVTGASGELGRVISRTVAKAGAAVALHYHKNEAEAKTVKEEIVAGGGRAMVVQADVSDKGSVFAMGSEGSGTGYHRRTNSLNTRGV